MALVAGWWHGVGCVAFTLLSVAFQVGIQMSNMNGRVHGPSCCSDIHPKGSGHVERDFFYLQTFAPFLFDAVYRVLGG